MECGLTPFWVDETAAENAVVAATPEDCVKRKFAYLESDAIELPGDPCQAARSDLQNSDDLRSAVAVDPQYGDALTKDEHYERVVAAVAEVAREARVLLVDRFEAMRELHRQRGDRFYLAADQLHMNDASYHCIARLLADSLASAALATPLPQADNPMTSGRDSHAGMLHPPY